MRTRGRDALLDIVDAYAGCDYCPALAASRTTMVFGSGSASAKVLVVGSHPGKDEDAAGIPFAGDAGMLLMSIFSKAWPDTEEITEIRKIDNDDLYFEELRDYLDDHIFWTNLLPCRPADEDGNNREPSAKEIKACSDRLYRTIYAVDPVVIVAVGKAAASKLLGKKVAATTKSGLFFDIEIPSPATGAGVRYAMMALVDPIYLISQGDQALVKKKRGSVYKAILDLQNLVHILRTYLEQAIEADFPEQP